MARRYSRRRAERIRPTPRRTAQRNPPDDQLRTGWNGSAIPGRQSQTTSAFTSLAQPRAPAHQEYKIAEEICFHVFQSGFLSTAENSHLLSGDGYRRNSASGHDFHGFLLSSRFTMWIWLESKAHLASSVTILTSSSDSGLACSQPVDSSKPLFITFCALSAPSTGIGYYYCIYIDISLYILRRSKRQAVQQRVGLDPSSRVFI